MKEKPRTTRAVALDSNEYFPPFEFPCGSIFLFSSIESKILSPYQYWGRLKLANGQLMYVRLWAFTSLNDIVFYKGYAEEKLETLRIDYSAPTKKDTGFCMLFNDPQPGELEAGHTRPQFTGKLYLGSEKLFLTLWKREGLNGIYYSGTIEPVISGLAI